MILDPEYAVDVLNFRTSGSDKVDYDLKEETFFSKLFAKMKENDDEFSYEGLIEKYGKDDLIDDLSNNPLVFAVDKNDLKTYVVLTDYNIYIPGQIIMPYFEISAFKLFYNEDEPFQTYAEDRKGIPYDPGFVSEYEGEETFELDRFSINLQIIDDSDKQYGLNFKIYLDVGDRDRFVREFRMRAEVEDYTSQDAIDGIFPEGFFDR